MEIYYIKTEEFLKKYDRKTLYNHADVKNFKSEKRFVQHALGRLLVKSAAENFYGITNSEIRVINNKPGFVNSNLHFSISHSGNVVAAAFDRVDCGLDIEEIKPRNLETLSKRYKKSFNSLEDFYRFWTEYEAEIKLQKKTQGKYSCVFQNNYILTVVSENPILSEPSCTNFLDVL